MAERPEEQILLQTISLTLGGETVDIPVKSMAETYQFRKELGKVVGGVLGEFGEEIAGLLKNRENLEKHLADLPLGATLGKALPIILADGPDALIKMLFLYAPELKKYEKAATEEELMDAALEVLRAAFPLLRRILTPMLRMIGNARGVSASPAPPAAT